MFLHSIVFILLIKGALLTRTPLSAKGIATVHPSAAKPTEARSRILAKESSLKSTSIKLIKPNPYKRFALLSDLVENRPQQNKKFSRKVQHYNEAFSDHPDITSLKLDNLDDVGKLKLARETLKLRDPNHTPAWQKRLTLSLRSHLEHKNVDTKTRNEILGYQIGTRLKRSRQKTQLAEKGNVEAATRRIERSKETYAKSKESKNRVQKQNRAFRNDLDDIIGFQRLASSSEVAKKAEVLREKYQDEKGFDAALRAYLVHHKYPTDEIALVRGSLVLDKEKERLAKLKAKRWAQMKQEAASTSASSASTREETSRIADRSQEKKAGKRARAGAIQMNKDSKRIKVALDPNGQVASSSTNIQKENVKGGVNIDEWECGPWWESGCFDD